MGSRISFTQAHVCYIRRLFSFFFSSFLPFFLSFFSLFSSALLCLLCSGLSLFSLLSVLSFCWGFAGKNLSTVYTSTSASCGGRGEGVELLPIWSRDRALPHLCPRHNSKWGGVWGGGKSGRGGEAVWVRCGVDRGRQSKETAFGLHILYPNPPSTLFSNLLYSSLTLLSFVDSTRVNCGLFCPSISIPITVHWERKKKKISKPAGRPA